jgi:hypothetical protein
MCCLCVNVYMSHYFSIFQFLFPFDNCCLVKGCECDCYGLSSIFIPNLVVSYGCCRLSSISIFNIGVFSL